MTETEATTTPSHPWGEWTEDEEQVIQRWGSAQVADAVEQLTQELRISRESERAAWRNCYAVQSEAETLRREANAAGVPDGWAVLTSKGEAVDFRGRVREFFGQLLDDDGLRPDAQQLAKRDDDFPGLAPHRCVPVYFGRPAPATDGATCGLCKNAPREGWRLYCIECIEMRMAPLVQRGTA